MKNLSLRSLLLGAFTLASLATGGCMLQVEADVPEVEITQHDVAFQGVAPAGVDGGDVALTQSFSQQHQRLELPTGLKTEVKAMGVTLTAKSGIDNFDFLKNMRVTMSDGVHTPVELINYERAAGAPSTNVLTIESANPVNTLDQWNTDAATFTLDVAGAMPSNDWTIDVSVRFAGKLVYNY
ncbi:MAG TPA: hypothetical protein VHL80_16455 [Polyangia bacterium]|nr:hypothetical protein [Polyangia bacterium]